MRLDEEIRGAMGRDVTLSTGGNVPPLLHGRWAIAPEAWSKVVALTRMAVNLSGSPALTDVQAAEMAKQQQGRVAGAVGVISLQGIIRPKANGLLALLFGITGGLESFRESFAELIGNPDVGSIVLDIDSPGGVTDMVPETAAMIREARGAKPIVAVANTMAASAAYYLASQADEVVVTPSGFLGSIGVFTVHDDWSGFNEKLGVDPTYIYAGKYKVEGRPDAPLSAEAKKAMQVEVDEFYDMFVEDVAAGRGVKVSEVRNGYGEGRTLTARRAQAAGLADRVDTLEATISRMVAGDYPGGDKKAQAQIAEQRRTQRAAAVDAMFDPHIIQAESRTRDLLGA